MPVTVRHKLDCYGLRLSLAQWQALPLATRADLLQLPAGATFALCAAAACAGRDTRRRQAARLQVDDIAQALDCAPAAAHAWLARATPFARSVRRTEPA